MMLFKPFGPMYQGIAGQRRQRKNIAMHGIDEQTRVVDTNVIIGDGQGGGRHQSG